MQTYKVYEHITPSGKRYIGLTRQPVERRWQRGAGYADNPYFYKAIKKYGWDSIQHNILAENLTAEEAARMEVDVIRQYQSDNREYGYNITEGGNVIYGASQKIGSANHKSAAILRIDPQTGETVRYESMNLAAKELGISRQGIGKATRGACGSVTYKGFLWQYADKEFAKPKRQPKGRPPETAFKPVYLLDENQEPVCRYDSLQLAAMENNCSYVGISKCCTGKLKTYHGRRWCYANDR